MIEFASDYSEGAHPKILEKIIQTNMIQTPGYGNDIFCEKASDIIKNKCEHSDVSVYFLVGGTQANLIAIASALRPHQCVLAPETGHICVQETGAIEAIGHKIITLPHTNGKITADQIRKKCDKYWNDKGRMHITQPKLVFITHSTELGTIYKRSELQEISNTCKEYNLYLYLDGARLGYGLYAEDSDMDLPFITKCCDAFYIGGTKQGTLFGEAMIIKNPELDSDFKSIMKQKGGLLAKGRLLGLQFIALLEDDLYTRLSKHANKMASLIRNALLKNNIKFFIDNTTNQLFPIINKSALEKLRKEYSFTFWDKKDEMSSIIRICTSWATTEENVQKFIYDIEKL